MFDVSDNVDVAAALPGLEHEGAVDGSCNLVSRAAVAEAGFAGVVDGDGTRTCVVDAFISLALLLLAVLRTLHRRATACRAHCVSA